jgi:hypothetical protein
MAAPSASSSSQQTPRSPQGQGNSRKPYEQQYQSLRDEASDPFADDYDTPVQGRRKQCEFCVGVVGRSEGACVEGKEVGWGLVKVPGFV